MYIPEYQMQSGANTNTHKLVGKSTIYRHYPNISTGIQITQHDPYIPLVLRQQSLTAWQHPVAALHKIKCMLWCVMRCQNRVWLKNLSSLAHAGNMTAE